VNQHIPVVRIVTVEPDASGVTRDLFTRITVDGREWAIVSYAVEGEVKDVQKVTLTFLADATIAHRSEPEG
jgi:hypothetical protein